MSNSNQRGIPFFSSLARVIVASQEIKTVYAVAAIALSFLSLFVFLVIRIIQPVNLGSQQFILLVSLFLITLVVILWIGRKEYPDLGRLVSDQEKAISPEGIYNDEQTISDLQNMVLFLAVADVSDYGATVNRLRRNLRNLTCESITAIGIYGEYDLLFEAIIKAEDVGRNVSIIKDSLEIEESIPIVFQEIKVKSIAKLSGSAIGGKSENESLQVVELENGQFKSKSRKLSYKVININYLKNSGDLGVANMPVVIAYIWIEVGSNLFRIQSNQRQIRAADKALLNMYEQLCQEDLEEVRSLYLVNNSSGESESTLSSVLIKSVFLVERYYALMRFTKKIDRMLRELGYSNLLQVRTVVGAEIILWR